MYANGKWHIIKKRGKEMKRMKGWKRFLSLLLGLSMLFQMIGMTAVAAKAEEPKEYTTTISHKQTSGETNFFKFADGKWETGVSQTKGY